MLPPIAVCRDMAFSAAQRRRVYLLMRLTDGAKDDDDDLLEKEVCRARLLR